MKDKTAQKVIYIPVRKVAKATVVNSDPLASIDHFDVIEVRFLHGFEMWYLSAHSCEVVLDGSA